MYRTISNDFTDRNITDFNGTKSVVSILRKGFFGPVSMNNTRLSNISNEYMLVSGNRLNALQYIYNASIRMQDTEFISNLTRANQEIINITNASDSLYIQLPQLLRDIDPFAHAGLLLLFIALILMGICFIFSNIAFCCVVKTQDRKFKILSNVSWFSSALSMIMIFTAGLGLSFSGPVLSDFCRIQELQQQKSRVGEYPRILNKKLAQTLHQCIYSDNKNVLTSLGIGLQVQTFQDLNSSLKTFKDIPPGPTTLSDLAIYYAELEDPWKSPATFSSFVFDPT